MITNLLKNKQYINTYEGQQFNKFLREDKNICYLIYNIKDDLRFNSSDDNFANLCESLLKQIRHNQNSFLSNKFYIYMTGKIQDPCSETENKYDIVNLIYEYIP